jgi:hypothetical protein
MILIYLLMLKYYLNYIQSISNIIKTLKFLLKHLSLFYFRYFCLIQPKTIRELN